MGAAKARREAFRQAALVDIARWLEPPTAAEADLFAVVSALPLLRIPRGSPEMLAYCRMEAQQCHLNASAYARLDPTKRSKMVSGWWKRGDDFVFHSVIHNGDTYACVTPFDENELHFAPDEAITWDELGDGRRIARRDGAELPYGLRADPAKTMAQAELVRTRLLSGMNPWRALEVSEPTS